MIPLKYLVTEDGLKAGLTIKIKIFAVWDIIHPTYPQDELPLYGRKQNNFLYLECQILNFPLVLHLYLDIAHKYLKNLHCVVQRQLNLMKYKYEKGPICLHIFKFYALLEVP